MNKEFILAIYKKLKEEVTSLRWVDLDSNQLNVQERPPVAFPCCLIELSYPQCQTLTSVDQRVRVQFTLRIAFDEVGSTHSNTPENVLEKSLARYDVLNDIHKALQWWDGDKLWTRLKRVSCRPQKRMDKLKEYEVVYEAECFD